MLVSALLAVLLLISDPTLSSSVLPTAISAGTAGAALRRVRRGRFLAAYRSPGRRATTRMRDSATFLTARADCNFNAKVTIAEMAPVKQAGRGREAYPDTAARSHRESPLGNSVG